MSGKDFFIERYKKLGWKYCEDKVRQAIRINRFNTRETDAVKRLSSIRLTLQKIPFLSDGYWVDKSEFSAGATIEYLLGLYSIQDAAAQIPVSLFKKLEDKLVLDACAAPGGKTVQLADRMRNSGAIFALDIKKDRLVALENQLERCQVQNAITYLSDSRDLSRFNTKFDAILLDMPCSGNFAGDGKWFQRRTLRDVKRNADLQRQIMNEAVKKISDCGEIIYSTCSLEPEENELNIDWAINSLGLTVEKIDCYGQEGLTEVFGERLDDSLKYSRRIWPYPTQGFFVCKLTRRE